MYKTLTAQTIHYFARPQARVLREPLSIPAAWKGGELAPHGDWRETLTGADVLELEGHSEFKGRVCAVSHAT